MAHSGWSIYEKGALASYYLPCPFQSEYWKKFLFLLDVSLCQKPFDFKKYVSERKPGNFSNQHHPTRADYKLYYPTLLISSKLLKYLKYQCS